MAAGVLLAVTASCAVTHVQHGPPVSAGARWVLLPVMNFSETPQAGERLEAILANLLRIRGIKSLAAYPPTLEGGEVAAIEDRQRVADALAWAKKQGFTYAATGAVQEWHYRGGLDAEPAVGCSVQVLDVGTGRVLWSASGARSGWGRDTVSGTAEKLVQALLSELRLK